MKTLLKVALSLFVVLVVVVAAGGIYIATLDLNDHKDTIADRVREQTGRELIIAGTIEHTLYPWLGVSMSQVSLSDDPAFSTEPFAEIGQLELRIKLLPLLSGSYEIDTVTLHDTRINLITAADGRNNWDSLSPAVEEPETASQDSGFTMPEVVIGGIDIRNFNVSMRDDRTGQVTTLGDMAFTTDALTLGEPLEMTMSGLLNVNEPALQADLNLQSTLAYDLSGQAWSLDPLSLAAELSGPEIPGGTASLNLDTAISANLDAGTLSVPSLTLSLLDLTVTADLNWENINDAPALSGNLSVQGTDLGEVLRAIGQTGLAAQVAATGDQSVSINTSFDYDSSTGSLDVPALNAALLGASIEGNLAARGLSSDAPGVSGALTASGPDLPALLQLAGRLQGSDSALTEYGSMLAGYPGSHAFAVDTQFDATPASGNINLPALSVNALGLVLQGNLAASDMDSNNGSANGELSLRGSNLKPLLRSVDQASLAEVLDSLALDVRLSGSRQSLSISPLSLALDFTGGDIPGGAATLTLAADSVLSLSQDTANISRFSLNGLGLDLQGNVSASNISSPAPSVSGNLNLPEFNLRRFLESINQPVPVTSDETVLQKVTLSTGFGFDDQVFSLEELNATLDDSTLTGSFSADTGDSGAIRFDLALDSINIDRYLAPGSEEAPQESAEAELPVETLRDLDINGTVTAGTVMASNLTLNAIQATIVADGGLITLNPVRAELYEGSYAGNIRLDVTTGTPSAVVGTELTSINLEPLMTDYMGSAMVSGTGNISLNVSGRGANTAAIRESLGGQGSISLQDGILTGVDVASVLRQVETMLRNRRLANVDRGQQTAFDSFSASFMIDQGVVTSNDLLIASPGFSVAGSGTLVDLREETIAFNLLTTVDETTVASETDEYDLGGYSLPIACTGSAASPRCLPDLAQIARTAFTNEVRDQIGGFLQRALGGDEQAAPETETTPDNTQPLQEESPETEAEPAQEANPRQQLNDALNRLLR